MRSLNVSRIIAIIAFLSLAGFSCFWTAESIYIWQPNITLAGAWLIAVVFYVIASICFSMLLKAIDKRADFYGKLGGRTGAFLLGFFGLLIFWIGLSLPTNTHTLLYRGSIKNVLENDLSRTQGYLKELQTNNTAIEMVKQKYNAKVNAVNALFVRMEQEMERPNDKGIGSKFNTILLELEATLTEDAAHPVKIQRQPSGKTHREWVDILTYYRSQASDQLNLYKIACNKEIEEIQAAMDSEKLDKLINETEEMYEGVKDMNGVNDKKIANAVRVLNTDYSYIKNYAQYIPFKGKDKEIYTRPVPVAEAQVMRSVPEVWYDYFTARKYSFDNGFIWWVLLALLVDISAFVFFNMAFNSKSNNSI